MAQTAGPGAPTRGGGSATVWPFWARFAQLLVGLVLFGGSVALLVRARLGMGLRWVYLLGGILLNGVATGAYIGAGLGPGPRDGLMMGLAGRGYSIRVARTAIELMVLLAGFLLGGTVGIGTLLYAVSIGPVAHLTIPALSLGRVVNGEESARRFHGPGAQGRCDATRASVRRCP